MELSRRSSNGSRSLPLAGRSNFGCRTFSQRSLLGVPTSYASSLFCCWLCYRGRPGEGGRSNHHRISYKCPSLQLNIVDWNTNWLMDRNNPLGHAVSTQASMLVICDVFPSHPPRRVMPTSDAIVVSTSTRNEESRTFPPPLNYTICVRSTLFPSLAPAYTIYDARPGQPR
jgi:hypothetical protein